MYLDSKAGWLAQSDRDGFESRLVASIYYCGGTSDGDPRAHDT